MMYLSRAGCIEIFAYRNMCVSPISLALNIYEYIHCKGQIA